MPKSSFLSRLINKPKFSVPIVIILVAAFAVAGYFIFFSRAASPSTAIDTSTGALSCAVTKVTDSTAVSGSAIKFGSGSCTQPPQPAVVQPKNGDTVSGSVTIAISVANYVAGQKVQAFINGALIGDADSSNCFSFWCISFDSTKYANGTKLSINAQTYDAAGKSYPSLAVSVTVTNIAPTGHDIFGIAEPPWYVYENGGNAAYLQRLNLMKQLGVGWLRTDFPIGRMGNSEMNDIYNGAINSGIKIIATDNSSFDTDTASYVRSLLSHYPKISVIEIGNEENLFGGAGTPNIDTTTFVGYMAAAYDAKQAVNPAVKVIIGGIAAYGSNDPHNPNNYLAGILSAAASYKSAHGHFPWDGIGYHPYDDQSAPVPGGATWGAGLAQNLHNAAVAKGDPGIIYNTEYGYSETGKPPSNDINTAASWLNSFGAWWRQQSWTATFMYFNLDTPLNQTGREAGFGLIDRTNGSPATAAKRATFNTYLNLAHQ